MLDAQKSCPKCNKSPNLVTLFRYNINNNTAERKFDPRRLKIDPKLVTLEMKLFKLTSSVEHQQGTYLSTSPVQWSTCSLYTRTNQVRMTSMIEMYKSVLSKQYIVWEQVGELKCYLRQSSGQCYKAFLEKMLQNRSGLQQSSKNQIFPINCNALHQSLVASRIAEQFERALRLSR